MGKQGKKFRAAQALIDPANNYTPEQAVGLVKQAAFAKFDETVEVHLRMNVDPRQADQQLRGVVSLPSGSGKTVRILVFAEGDAARQALEAGADHVGVDEFVTKIQEGWLDFDVAVAVPQVMGRIGRLGRVLGPRGLMPNPKAGTVVQPGDVPATIRELRGGRVEYRVDRTGNLHIPIGKVSFSAEALLNNWAAVMEVIVRSRPSAVRGQYIMRVAVTSTMGPGVKVDMNLARDMHPA